MATHTNRVDTSLSSKQQTSLLEASSLPMDRGQSGIVALLLARNGLLLALVSLVVNLTWIVFVPPLRGPDETAHLMAVMEVRTLGRLPEIHYDFSKDPVGLPVPPYDDPTVAAYAQSLGLPSGAYSVSYESMQPPLFYLAAGLVALPFSPDPQTVLFISKLVAALFGAATVYFIWAAVRQLSPSEPLFAMLTAGCVALLPVFAYDSSSANNDSALYTVCAALFYVWLRGLRDARYDPLLLKAGALLGLGLLAKLTMLTFVPAFGLVILYRASDSNDHWRRVLRRMIILSLTSASAGIAVAGWWLIRNLIVYGDISGSADALKWYSTHQAHADLSSLQKLGDFASATFVSFVGLFSWGALLFPANVYRIAEAVVLALVLFSTIAFVRRCWKRTSISREGKRSIAIFGLAALGVLAGYLQYNVSLSYQPQARYLFALLLPASVALLGGLYVLVRDARRRVAWILLGVPPGLLVLLNWMAITMLSSSQ